MVQLAENPCNLALAVAACDHQLGVHDVRVVDHSIHYMVTCFGSAGESVCKETENHLNTDHSIS